MSAGGSFPSAFKLCRKEIDVMFPRSVRPIWVIALALATLPMAGPQPAAMAESDDLIEIGAPPVPAPLDTDTAAGLDNVVWMVPKGTQIARAPVFAPSSTFRAPGEGVDPPEGAHVVQNACGKESPADSDKIDVMGCWKIYRLDLEDDSAADYFPVTFKVQGTGRGDHGFVRVKGRNGSNTGHNVDWDPGADQSISSTREVGVQVTAGPVSVSNSFTSLKGRIHPYAGESVFHSSWMSPDSRHISRPGAAVQSAGINIWSVPQGGYPSFTWGGDAPNANNWEVWYESKWDW
ncbi:MAG: hypothetical protein ACRD0C_19385 [Acidimicrobiia bacterium]